MEIQDQRIVVTGAARGIGKALCERFASQRPRSIVLADRDESAVKSAAAMLETKTGITTLAVECDVANESHVRDLVQRAEEMAGGIDLFCANAGIAPSGGVEAGNDVWEQVMQVNFMAHVYSSRAVIPMMTAQGSGYLLHVASAAGLLTSLGSAPYAVSKHAALALAEWLAITHHGQGIGVSCLCPMGVFTDMIDSDEPAIQMLQETAITTDEVAEAVVEGLRENLFLIAPHPQAIEFFRNKANDYERWLGGMLQIQQRLDIANRQRDASKND